MAYLKDIRYNEQIVGTLQSDGWVTWPEIADKAPDALKALHDQRYASQSEAEATIQAVINRLPAEPEPVTAPEPEPVVSQPVNAETSRRKAAKKH